MAIAIVKNFASQQIAESHGDLIITITPLIGPNAGVACETRSCSEFTLSLQLAGDHVMGNATIGPVAVAHTEAKPQGSINGMNAREQRRILEHMGGALVPCDIEANIGRPGLATDVYTCPGAIFTGDFGGLKSSSGSIPTNDADFLCATPKLNGKDLITDGRDALL